MRLHCFSKKLLELRKSRNLTTTELAKKSEISQQAISSWENEKREPNINALIKLADVFQITLDELVGRTGVGNKK
jgi:transcriptional regulator with XRE-family HTH domain